jgi:hypothetical protein
MAAGKGKQLAPSTKTTAKAAFDALLSRQAAQDVREQQTRSGVPTGAGNKQGAGRPRPFLTDPNTDPLRNGDAGALDFSGLGG